MKLNRMLFGSAYYAEYLPYERVEKDMKMMKAAGMNVIRIAESTWSTWEPYEGCFDFTQLDLMLGAAQKYGIDIIIGTPTYAIPTWLAEKSEDILALTKNGQELYGKRQNMDITNPIYLQYAERMIRKLLEHVKNENHIIGFQLDNETKYYDTAGPRVHSLFVKYLTKLFPNISDMNKAFGLDFWSNRINRWEDFPDVRQTINGSLGAEFAKFQRSLVTHFFKWQADIVNEYRTKEQFITHNFDYEWRGYSFGIQPNANQYAAAKHVTVAGVDIYHASEDDLTGIEIAFGGAVGRGLKDDNYFVLETQAQGNTGWLPYEGQLRLQAFSHISSGADMLSYWHWHSIHNSFESYWKGILSHDLKENPTYLEVKTIGRDLSNIGEKILHLTKCCQAAIIVNNESLTGMEWFPIDKDLNYNDNIRWIYDACYRLNIECDIIPDTYDCLEKYQLLITPVLYSASEHVLNKINDYVKNGGHLLSTYKTGFSDEHIKIYHDSQPHQLTACFGMTYNQFTIPKAVTLSETTFEISPNHTVTKWMELLTPSTAKVWAKYEHSYWNQYAAVTHNKFGLGSATYIGCHFDSTTLEQLILSLFKELKLDTIDAYFPIIIKKGINQFNKEVLYYFNYSNHPHAVSCLKTGENILSKEHVEKDDVLSLLPWDFIITEC